MKNKRARKTYPRFFVDLNNNDDLIYCYRLDSSKGPTKIFYKISEPTFHNKWTIFDFNQSVKEKLIKEILPSEAALLI